jgi:1,4-dihydroxy-2-naphthoate octaprenyltransferase
MPATIIGGATLPFGQSAAQWSAAVREDRTCTFERLSQELRDRAQRSQLPSAFLFSGHANHGSPKTLGFTHADGSLAPIVDREAIATLFGSYLVWHVGWPIVVIGVLSIASGIAYTGGPYPLGYNGLGDVFVMIFFGFVAVLGTVLVQTAELPLLGWLASIPVGAIATAILVVNNVRDRETDVVAGKRTLVVRHGRRFGELEYVALLALAYVVPLGLAVTTSAWIALPLASAPLALGLVGRLRREEGAPLNATLAATAKLLLVHGLLFAAGLWLSRG